MPNEDKFEWLQLIEIKKESQSISGVYVFSFLVFSCVMDVALRRIGRVLDYTLV